MCEKWLFNLPGSLKKEILRFNICNGSVLFKRFDGLPFLQMID